MRIRHDTQNLCATNQISCIISFFAFEAIIRKVYCIPLFALRKIMVLPWLV